jgi:hypothetical protein
MKIGTSRCIVSLLSNICSLPDIAKQSMSFHLHRIQDAQWLQKLKSQQAESKVPGYLLLFRGDNIASFFTAGFMTSHSKRVFIIKGHLSCRIA